MLLERQPSIATWYYLLLYAVICSVICSVDAKPDELDRRVAKDKLPVVAARETVHERVESGEFWTRWNSDTDTNAEGSEEDAIFSAEDGSDFALKLHKEKIVSLDVGCGRGKNRLGTLVDGTKFCCRYRELQWRDIRGELYAYHLNNLLGMYNAPPATLIKVNFSSPQWRGVAGSAREAGWSDRMTVIATLFVDELVEETFPPVLAESDSVVTKEYLIGASPKEKSRILQWSDLIVFDFMVGHSDRIFNTLFNLQWNKKMMQRPIHNLLKTKHGGKLLLFDNESGFWLGYKMGWREASKYEMQERFLRKMCIFRDRTLHRLEYLLQGNQTLSAAGTTVGDSESPSQRLDRYIKDVDRKSFQMVEPLGTDQRREFASRLRIVLKQVEKCQKRV